MGMPSRPRVGDVAKFNVCRPLVSIVRHPGPYPGKNQHKRERYEATGKLDTVSH
uniref:Uncharacterized protein n=1 Tax=Ralstonia solanacearum TaxID=305 RepID=A0A0S4XFZ3_RALSL|nr:protein of unknown function [Ralstonia solanacearum]CUV62877.1 protein of unknown function [Ralstonia solanacearum]